MTARIGAAETAELRPADVVVEIAEGGRQALAAMLPGRAAECLQIPRPAPRNSPRRTLLSPAADLPGADEFERGAHLPIRAAPGELGGHGPQVDAVLVAEGVAPDAVLLVMVKTAEADAEDIVRPLTLAGIGGRTEMGKVDALGVAIGDAAAVRSNPAAVPRPDLL